jgi:hypothetical protein
LALALVLVSGTYWRASAAPINAADTWDHWSYGRWIWENRRLPDREPFTAYSDPAAPVNLCWLSQVGGYLLYAAGGMEAIALAYGLVEAVKWALLTAACRRAAGSWLLGVAGVAALYAGRWAYVGVFRPQAVGEIAWAVLLIAAVRPPWPKWAVAAAPFAVLFWVNVHPSFLLAFVLLGILLVGRALTAAWTQRRLAAAADDADVRRLLLTLGLCLAAACVNPHGPRHLIEAIKFGQTPVFQVVGEWGPLPPLRSYTGWALSGSYVVVLATLRTSRRRFTAADAMLLGLFGVAAWFSQRMIPFWWTDFVPVLLPHAAVLLDRTGWARSSSPGWTRWAPAVGAVAAAGIACLSPTAIWFFSSRPRPVRDQFDERTPVVVASDLREQSTAASLRVYCDLAWSDYFLWSLPPTDQLYWYTHWHAFGQRRLLDGQQLTDLHSRPNEWRSILARSRVNVIALPNDRYPQPHSREAKPLFAYLREERSNPRSDWEVTLYPGDLRDGGEPYGEPSGLVARRRTDPFVLALAEAQAAQGCVGGGLCPMAGGWCFLTDLPWHWPDP